MFDSQDTKCKLRKPQWKVPVQDFSHHPKKDVIYPVPLPQWATLCVFTELLAKQNVLIMIVDVFVTIAVQAGLLFFPIKKPLSYPLKESRPKLCLGFVKQCVMVTFSEFSL